MNRDKQIAKLGDAHKVWDTVTRGLKGGIVYHDDQFDDARMAVNLAQTCIENRGCAINYTEVVQILHDTHGKVAGVKVRDLESGKCHLVHARSVINAAGCFVDDIMKMDTPDHSPMVVPSQGVHLMLDMKFLKSNFAMMIPKTSDGRVLFAVPWHGKVIVGTTDTPREKALSEPVALDREIDFILSTAGRYIDPAPTRSDIFSVFAGQRPLAAPDDKGKKTKEISRSHKIIVSDNHLVTITGGKWTSYRLMAEDTVTTLSRLGILPHAKCRTRHFRIHGWVAHPDLSDRLHIYGSDAEEIRRLEIQHLEHRHRLSERYHNTEAQVVWAVHHEMARTVEDVLARRIRLLFLDAREAVKVAPRVAEIMARELQRDSKWQDKQVEAFTAVAANYCIGEH